MTVRGFLLAAVSALLLQLILVNWAPGVAGHVDFLLVALVAYALTGNSLGALLVGMFCGLLSDALSGAPYGLFGIADTIVGYSVAQLAQRLDTRRTGALLLVFAGAAALQQGVLMLLELVVIPRPALPQPLTLAAVVISTALLGPLLRALRKSLSRRARLRRLRRPKPHL